MHTPPPQSNIDFNEILLASQKWMESEEFKEKYLKTNHPYPPLLNPDDLNNPVSPFNYKNIPADFAWEANLPLPRGYKFLFVMMSHSGHSSMVSYLKKCGVSIMKDHYGVLKEHYKFNYDALNNGEPTVINFTAYGTAGDDYYVDLYKYIRLIDPNTPVLCLVRDPIPRLKTTLNNRLGKDYWGKATLKYHFNENDSLDALDNRLVYILDRNINYKDRVEAGIKGINLFRYSEVFEKLLEYGFKDFEFLDVQKIIEPPDVFVLMQKLAQQYDFPPPTSPDIFDLPSVRVYSGFLPLRYDVRGAQFLITVQPDKGGNIEVSQMLGLDLSYFQQFERGILIYTRAQDLPDIQNNFDFIKAKLSAFILKFQEILERENKLRMTNIPEILEFFKTAPRHRKLFRDVIKKEIEIVKKSRPDIVAQWNYYLEFQKICQTLDGVK